MSEKPRGDQDFEAFVERRDALSRHYRETPRDEPSAELDERILAASRRAPGSRPRAAGAVGWIVRWRAPVAAAAVLVIAVTLAVLLEREPEVGDLGGAGRSAPGAPQAEMPRSPGPSQAAEQKRSGPPRLPSMAKPEAAAPSAQNQALPSSQQETRGESRPVPAPSATATGALREPATAEHAGAAKAAGSADSAATRAPETAAGESTGAAEDAARQRVAQIEALYLRGDNAAGDEALRSFCRDFPGYPLPAALVAPSRRLAPACGTRN